jgi:hypothetical protein
MPTDAFSSDSTPRAADSSLIFGNANDVEWTVICHRRIVLIRTRIDQFLLPTMRFTSGQKRKSNVSVFVTAFAAIFRAALCSAWGEENDYPVMAS